MISTRRIYSNSSLLIAGNFFKFAFGIAAYAITARLLGPKLFGAFALIQAYVAFIDRLFNFQSWQMLIKCGCDLLEKKDCDQFNRLIKLSFFLDLLTAILAMVLAIACGTIFLRLSGLAEDNFVLLAIYSLTILFNLSGVPLAALRLFDRFDRIAICNSSAALIKLLLVTIVFYLGWGIAWLVAAWAFGEILERLLLLFFGFRTLSENALEQPFERGTKGPIKNKKLVFSFLLHSNLESAVRLCSREIDIFLVAALLDFRTVAFYKLIKESCMPLVGVADTLYHSSMPVISELWTSKSYAKIKSLLAKMRINGVVFVSLAAIIYFAFGEFAIAALFGEDYKEIFLPLGVAAIGPALWLVQAGYSSTILAMGMPEKLFRISLWGSILSLSLHLYITKHYGLPGASISFLSFFLLWAVMSYSIVERRLNEEVSREENV